MNESQFMNSLIRAFYPVIKLYRTNAGTFY